MKSSRGSFARRDETENRRMRNMIFFKKVSLRFTRGAYTEVYSKEVKSSLYSGIYLVE
jgi:hypothetical protein